MGFHPAVDEDAPGFWAGYYKGLAAIFGGLLILVHVGVLIHALITFPLDQIIPHLHQFYSSENTTFYLVQVVLLIIGCAAYGIGLYVDHAKGTATDSHKYPD